MIYTDHPWWTAHKENRDAHDTLIGLFESIKTQQTTRVDNTRKLISIFEWGYKASEYAAQVNDPALQEELLAFNPAQNVVETVLSKVCKSRVMPMALTAGGGYLQRQRAKEKNKAIEGELDENDHDRIKEDVVTDALVTAHGAGCAKVFWEWGKIKIEHVPIEDIYIDDAEGRLRSPRSLIQRHFVDRYVALELYGKDDPALYGDMDTRKRAILSVDATDPEGRMQANHEMIEIVEAWHLPSKPVERDEDGEIIDHDGRWTVCIDGATLVDQPWSRPRFPFAFYVPRRRRRSFWGISLMQTLAAGQHEYEKITYRIQKAHHLMGGTHVVAQRAANVNLREINNDQGTFIEYDGPNQPVEWNPAPVNPQTYQYQASIAENMMRHTGVNALSASGQIPAGLSQASGKALQVYEDFEAERLLVYHRALERWMLDLSELIVDEAREAVSRGDKYKVRYRGKRGIEAINWEDVLLDQDEYVLRTFPVSMLAKTPSAKFAQLQELLNAGAITVEQFKRLFELPDIESETEIDVADTEIIDRNLDLMVTKGVYNSPEPFDDLKLCVLRAGKFYNVCRAQEVPDDKLELIRNYISDAQALMEQANPPAPPAAPAPPPMPPGPEAPPMPPQEMPVQPPMAA